MRALKSFVLGMVAFGVLGYALSAAVAMTAQVGGRQLDVRVGPLPIVSVALRAGETATTFGIGILVLSVLGGIVNLGCAMVIARRSVGSVDRVD